MGEDDAYRLPPAHRRFTAHFTAPFYDADDFNNDDIPPFGSDEGSDAVHDWADRLDELSAHPTLRHMLGDTADEQVAELRNSEQTDVDDIIIGLGFTLLRFTGHIDPEGQGWLVEALARQDGRTPGGEYATMLDDLASFDQSETGQARPAKTNTPKKAKSWLSISGSNEEELEAWFRRTARAVASDPAWREWWSEADIDYLLLQPRPIGHPDQDQVQFELRGSRLEVIGSSAALNKISWSLLEAEDRDQNAPDQPFRSLPGVAELMDALVLRLLRQTAEHLQLPPPPTRLPD